MKGRALVFGRAQHSIAHRPAATSGARKHTGEAAAAHRRLVAFNQSAAFSCCERE